MARVLVELRPCTEERPLLEDALLARVAAHTGAGERRGHRTKNEVAGASELSAEGVRDDGRSGDVREFFYVGSDVTLRGSRD